MSSRPISPLVSGASGSQRLGVAVGAHDLEPGGLQLLEDLALVGADAVAGRQAGAQPIGREQRAVGEAAGLEPAAGAGAPRVRPAGDVDDPVALAGADLHPGRLESQLGMPGFQNVCPDGDIL